MPTTDNTMMDHPVKELTLQTLVQFLHEHGNPMSVLVSRADFFRLQALAWEIPHGAETSLWLLGTCWKVDPPLEPELDWSQQELRPRMGS